MASYLSLPRARIFLLSGWGKVIKSDAHDYRVELVDGGEFVIYQPGLLRDKMVVSIPLGQLGLNTYTKQITSGGGWVTVGFGVTGIMLNAAYAHLLNHLTTDTQEYTLLGAVADLPNGVRREAILGFRNLDESDLRDRISAAIPVWAEAYVAAAVDRHEAADPQHHDLQRIHREIDRLQAIGLVNRQSALALHGRASEPFIAALGQRLHETPTSQQQAQQIKAEIDQGHARGRLTSAQARQIVNQLAPVLAPPPPPAALTEAQRRQIDALNALRSLGAMSQTQFEAEKARLVNPET